MVPAEDLSKILVPGACLWLEFVTRECLDSIHTHPSSRTNANTFVRDRAYGLFHLACRDPPWGHPSGPTAPSGCPLGESLHARWIPPRSVGISPYALLFLKYCYNTKQEMKLTQLFHPPLHFVQFTFQEKDGLRKSRFRLNLWSTTYPKSVL